MEIIIVLIILAIIASISIPSVVGFIWHGQQTNRSNIARTLYISMQNQLTRNMLEGNLRQALTRHFYPTFRIDPATGELYKDPVTGDLVLDPINGIIAIDDRELIDGQPNPGFGYYRLVDPNTPGLPRVSESLGAQFPVNDIDNAYFVFSVMLPFDFNPNTIPTTPEQRLQLDFYNLLNEVIINKELLNFPRNPQYNNSVFMMEFNIRTGVVMSIFYGDNLGDGFRGPQEEFIYDGANNTRNNVTGGRGMDNATTVDGGVEVWTGYEFALDRGQGYFGVDFTGEPLNIQLPDIVDIFDGKNADKPLNGRENVLYAELLIPYNSDTQRYKLDLIKDDRDRNSVISSTYGNIEVILPVNDVPTINDAILDLRTAINPLHDELFYKPNVQDINEIQHGINVSSLYVKYIWVLDCVYGNLFGLEETNRSITKYGITEPGFVRAKVTRIGGINNGLETLSRTTDHSHFGGELSGTDHYNITSVRHLSNMRDKPTLPLDQPIRRFLQTVDIDMRKDTSTLAVVDGPVTNFKPIVNFRDTYTSVATTVGAPRPRVLNLVIDANVNTAAVGTNIGLFADIANTGKVNGMSIFGGKITTTGTVTANVGAIAGLNRGEINFSYSYSNILKQQSTSESNTGGLVGYNHGGLINQCFNAGFFDTNPLLPNGSTLRTHSDAGIGSVRSGAGTIGGLVGKNEGIAGGLSGRISNSFNNARVNIEDVKQNEEFKSVAEKKHTQYLLSVDDPSMFTTVSGTTHVGGIAGENAQGGIINRTYATNYVAKNTATSGGIAGVNATGSIITDSLFLENGTTNPSGVTKEELMKATEFSASALFNQGNMSYLESNLEGYNEYHDNLGNLNYPYPTLRNNRIDNFNWGWEEIKGEIEPKLFAFVYYEVYDPPAPIRGYYNTLEDTPPPNPLGLRSDKYVLHDGYCIEFIPNSAGYTLFIGNERITIEFPDGVDTLITDVIITNQTTNTILELPNINKETFLHEMPDTTEPENMFRILIPNNISEKWYTDALTAYTGPAGNFDFNWIAFHEIYLTETLDQLKARAADDNDDLEIEAEANYVPLFAPNAAGSFSSHIIRSPRHLENISQNEAANVLAVPTYSQSYQQAVNLNIATYYKEYEEWNITANHWINRYVANDPISQAVIKGTFTGTYDGNSCYISGLLIYAEANTNNIGLFSVNHGIIEKVSLRLASYTDDVIRGRGNNNNVGGIVGSNVRTTDAPDRGIIRYCSVQQSVTRFNNQLPAYTLHPAAVSGTSNVGGIAGVNTGGMIHDVTVVSTSARPAVAVFGAAATSSATLGGVVGSTTTTVDNMMYLAVAPRTNTTGTGRNLIIRPFTGAGSLGFIGSNTYYLSGSKAIRPFQTNIFGATPALVDDYNFYLNTDTPTNPPTAQHTYQIIETARLPQFSTSWSNWSMNAVPDMQVTSQTNLVFPYPYPTGTIAPDHDVWPIVVPLSLPDNVGVIYYEIYDGGGIGLYTTFFDLNLPILNDEGVIIGYETVYVDTLRYDNPVILEAGYGVETTSIGNENANRPVLYSRDNGISSRRFNAGGGGGQLQLGSLARLNVPYLQGRRIRILSQRLCILAAEAGNANPNEPYILWVNMDSGNTDSLTNPAAAAYINPFFAKAVYPLRYAPPITGEQYRILSPQVYPDSYSIRTPYQMQNISRVTGYTEGQYSPANGGSTAGLTFIQEVDLHFGSIIRQNGSSFTYTETPNPPTTPIAGDGQGNGGGTRAVMNGSTTGATANIVTGNFAGIYDGNGRTITSLSMLGNTAHNKGLFNTILGETSITDLVGTVKNVTMVNCLLRNGSTTTLGGNGSIASRNYGTISDIVFISAHTTATAPTPPVSSTNPPVSSSTAGNAGGIVWTNNGTIKNILYLAHAPYNNPITAINNEDNPVNAVVHNAYYLSGSLSLDVCPISVPLANANFNHNITANTGEPRTTQELNAMRNQKLLDLEFGNLWRQSTMLMTANTVNPESQVYPYPIIGTAVPATWPIATVPIERLAYYEIYEETNDDVVIERKGFYSPGYIIDEIIINGIDTLKEPTDSLKIVDWGYCAIVPRDGSYSIKYTPIVPLGVQTSNMHIQSEQHTEDDATLHYVRFTHSNNNNPILNFDGTGTGMPNTINVAEIFVNDRQVINTNSRIVNRLFAKSIYATTEQSNTQELFIRTPQQMRNIVPTLPVPPYPSIGRTYIQENNLDFSNINLTTSIVNSEFQGTYDGKNKTISNVNINSTVRTNNSVGIFNAISTTGTVKDFCILFDSTIITGGGENVGGVAGSNNGLISNLEISYSGSAGVTGDASDANIGGVAGSNNGIIEKILLSFNGPAKITGTGAAANIGSIAGINSNIIKDLTVISTFVDDSVEIKTTFPPVQGANAAGVVGSMDEGEITRVLYLAPAPVNRSLNEFYPVLKLCNNLSDITVDEVYYLAGSSLIGAAIMNSSGIVQSELLGYNYEGLTQAPSSIGKGRDINTMITDISEAWDVIWDPVNAGWIHIDVQSIDYINNPPTVYPYPRNVGDPPASWPVVHATLPNPPVLPTPEPASSTDSIDKSDETDYNDVDYKTNGINGYSTGDDLDDAVKAATGIITFIGAYGLIKPNLLRNLIKRRDAIAIRKINEYNDKKRQKK